MQVSELFQRLSFGELSNLAVSGEASGDILDEKKPQILHFANLVLTQLYSRFILKESNLLLEQHTGITLYQLDAAHAQSNPAPAPGTVLYIQDTIENPFEDDLLRVISVFDHNGVELPLNDANECRSVFTPQQGLLQVPSPIDGAIMAISYQARHAKLTVADPSQVIELPVFLEEALTAGIAYHVFSNMVGQENLAKAQEQDARYERVISVVETKDLALNSVGTSNLKFHARGFV